ncbi:MAG: MarR family winged helix-turn-helix transcriptional regulator [Acidimicrobiia bacterium]
MATLLRLARLMHLSLRAIEASFAPHGITLGEFHVLAALRRGGDGNAMTPTALARVANGLPAGMTNRLDRLEAADLVARRPDPSDRRGSLVELTPTGRATTDRAVADHVATEGLLRQSLSAPDHRRFDTLLDTLLADLESRHPDDGRS